MEGRGGEEKESSSHKPLFIAYSPKSDDVSSAVESEISLKSQKSQNNETLKEESMRRTVCHLHPLTVRSMHNAPKHIRSYSYFLKERYEGRIQHENSSP